MCTASLYQPTQYCYLKFIRILLHLVEHWSMEYNVSYISQNCREHFGRWSGLATMMGEVTHLKYWCSCSVNHVNETFGNCESLHMKYRVVEWFFKLLLLLFVQYLKAFKVNQLPEKVPESDRQVILRQESASDLNFQFWHNSDAWCKNDPCDVFCTTSSQLLLYSFLQKLWKYGMLDVLGEDEGSWNEDNMKSFSLWLGENESKIKL